MTAISGEIRYPKVADSNLYRDGINSRYIEGGLSKSFGRKGPCARM